MNPDGFVGGNGLTALASLRRYVRPRAAAVRERCELCDAELAAEHSHLIEPASRRLVCACEACALLFCGQAGGRYRRVPRRVRYLSEFRLTDASWDSLSLPDRPGLLRAQLPGGWRHRPVSQPRGRDGVPGAGRGVGGAGIGEPDAPRPRAGRRGPAGESGRGSPRLLTASASTSATSSSASSARSGAACRAGRTSGTRSAACSPSLKERSS